MVPTFSHLLLVGGNKFPTLVVFITNGGHFVTSLGVNKYIGSLLEGDKSGHITLTTFVPPPIPLGTPFLSGKHI